MMAFDEFEEEEEEEEYGDGLMEDEPFEELIEEAEAALEETMATTSAPQQIIEYECDECGGIISDTDEYCPHCGVEFEFE
jgi:uncharacterized OB-fold protein